MTVQPDTNTPKDEMIAETVVIAEKIVLEGTGYGTWEHRLAEVLLAVVARCEEAEAEVEDTADSLRKINAGFHAARARAERAERVVEAAKEVNGYWRAYKKRGKDAEPELTWALNELAAALAASGPDTPTLTEPGVADTPRWNALAATEAGSPPPHDEGQSQLASSPLDAPGSVSDAAEPTVTSGNPEPRSDAGPLAASHAGPDTPAVTE